MLCGTAKKTHTFSFYIKIHCEALGNNENTCLSVESKVRQRGMTVRQRGLKVSYTVWKL